MKRAPNDDGPRTELRRIREALDMSQEDFAHGIGEKYRTYRRYETGETKKVPAEVLLKARALKKGA